MEREGERERERRVIAVWFSDMVPSVTEACIDSSVNPIEGLDTFSDMVIKLEPTKGDISGRTLLPSNNK